MKSFLQFSAGIACLFLAFALGALGWAAMGVRDDLQGLTADVRAELLAADRTMLSVQGVAETANQRLDELEPVIREARTTAEELHQRSKEAQMTILAANELLHSTRKAVTDTSSMVNANLIHSDIVLGRLEESTRKSDEATAKTLAILDRTDELIRNSNQAVKSVKQTADTANSDLQTVGTTLKRIDHRAEQILKPASTARSIVKGAIDWTVTGLKVFGALF